MDRILVTGGAGFMGSNFVRRLMKDTDYNIIVMDKLTYAGNMDNFPKEVKTSPRFEFIREDVVSRAKVREIYKRVDRIVHFAAETHIDRSIMDLTPFVKTDFVGTSVLLEEFLKSPKERFIHISTSEVYGTAQKIPMDESHPLEPQSPYAATKAGADRLVHSFYITYDLPLIILRPFNNYGPNQHPEKLIPLFITNAVNNRSLPIYGSGENTRDWLYVGDFCDVLGKVLEMPIEKIKGKIINIGTGKEHSVNEISEKILKILHKPTSLMKKIGDRPGHLKRLCCDTGTAKEILNWEASTKIEKGLELTVKWYLDNELWWRRIKRQKTYQRFYKSWYGRLMK